MWTFNRFPADRVGRLYGFAPDAAWLDHVRLGSLRLAQGCSASLISRDGLVLTNHHCARSCIEQLSSAGRDLVADGYLAAAAAEERRCPEHEADQLVGIADVTAAVTAATAGRDGAAFAAAEKAAIAAATQPCAGDASLRCDVVKLYRGGRYELYRYRRFQDVRLVFAPEEAIAFFGGDPDNFEFPRYDLDIALLRLYQDGRPLRAGDVLPLAAADAAAGELVFVSGNPGATSRLMTVAQLELERDLLLPHRLLYLAELRGRLTEFQGRGGEHARLSADLLFAVENTLKALQGRFAALVDPALIAAHRAAETALREQVRADPALAGRVGGAWDAIARSVERQRGLQDRYFLLEQQPERAASRLFRQARQLVRHAAESRKPNGERLPDYTDAALPALRQSLLSEAPVDPALEVLLLGYWLGKLRERLGPDDADVRALLGRESPDALARRLVAGTGLADAGLRRRLLEGGAAAIDAADDPMLAFARLADPAMRAVRSRFEAEVEAAQSAGAAQIAQAAFALHGAESYPDATFSPRLSFGTIRGYQENGRAIPPFTHIAGLYQRATGAPPYALPERWLAARDRLDPATPFNFVSDTDIIGGNSGSPVIDRAGRVVGVIFDGNIESLGGEYGFDPAVNRAVAVAVGAIRAALGTVYGAERLLREIDGAPLSATGAP
ncbi:MAG: S46 family peptidase [Dongiaceae bacterium]